MTLDPADPAAKGHSAANSHQELLVALKEHLPAMERLLTESTTGFGGEDLVYRFWHQSFKVYLLQDLTERITSALGSVCPPGTALNPWFLEIVGEGTGRVFDRSVNDNWLEHTRPIVEAFFHARFMLEMAVLYGESLDEAPWVLPSGWAALLELYQIR